MVTLAMFVFHTSQEGDDDVGALIGMAWGFHVLAETMKVDQKHLWTAEGTAEAGDAIGPKRCYHEAIRRGGG
jgi:hypothetical protein